MKRASGIGHLKPFLPGLEAVLEDPEVSELMINGPGNVWVERAGGQGAGTPRRLPLPGGDPQRPPPSAFDSPAHERRRRPGSALPREDPRSGWSVGSQLRTELRREPLTPG